MDILQPRAPKSSVLPTPPNNYDPLYFNQLLLNLRMYFGQMDAALQRLFSSTVPATVASADPLPITDTPNVFHVTGTTGFDDIAASYNGRELTLLFDGALTVAPSGTLLVDGAFVTNAGSTLKLIYDGTAWRELSRSAN